ncbi:MAG: peptidase T [Candidatus Lokiarchaeota archaeon]|nr:peptidase T [Candidatus Lokiarchaeota archaeon]MBD3201079.1 peptidase T [Candidatus Lokiarchaeota archaeon]
MKINKKIKDFIQEDTLERFLKYVKIWSTSEEDAPKFPSTENQIEFGKIIVNDLRELGINDIIHDKHGYIYANVPASEGFEDKRAIGLIAHLDTSPAVKGKDVVPVIHENYDGKPIKFKKDKELILKIQDSPELENYIGMDIISAQGDTLLGADDKAGIAEILAVCTAWQKFPEIQHGPVVVCFFPDEELGIGTKEIDLEKIPSICYTIDGGQLGELEYECFDAWKATIVFNGLSVHPGYAKNLMINAVNIACRFFSNLPEAESPRHTEDREGFYHLYKLKGNEEKATAVLIIRDYEEVNNKKRMEYLMKLKNIFEYQYEGLEIEISYEHQYENMINYLQKEEKIVDIAKKAIENANLELKIHSIRGGTDGAKLSAKGIPTPNIFTGGLLFHSRKEYIPKIALLKASEVILNLIDLWSNES